MKIGFIGVGKLGKEAAEVMAEKHDIVGYDVSNIEPENFKMVASIEEACKGREIIFIAVPTPHHPDYDGRYPTAHLPNKDFIYNPYLIAMGTVKWDMVNPEMIIIGTEDGSTTGDAKLLLEFYETFITEGTRYELGTWDEAEGIKIFYNTFISTKVALVNMIQDVAEKSGNINVDVITGALERSTQRILGPTYMKAGMGDGGACHPRDNIALRWLAKELDLGYDMFESIMTAREQQAESMAKAILAHGNNIWFSSDSYKPGVNMPDGSSSLLLQHYVKEHGRLRGWININTYRTFL